MRATHLVRALAVVAVLIGGAHRSEAQSIMVRGFGGASSQTCDQVVVLRDNQTATPAPDKREVIAGGAIGWHHQFLELSLGGVANFCPNAKPMLALGLAFFPIRTPRVLIGVSGSWDLAFADTTTAYDGTRQFFRPEGVVQIMLKHQSDSWTEGEEGQRRRVWREEGLALDIRGGIYQARSSYITLGFVFFVNAGER